MKRGPRGTGRPAARYDATVSADHGSHSTATAAPSAEGSGSACRTAATPASAASTRAIVARPRVQTRTRVEAAIAGIVHTDAKAVVYTVVFTSAIAASSRSRRGVHCPRNATPDRSACGGCNGNHRSS